MSSLHSSYTKILSQLHLIEPQDNFLSQIRMPKLSDKELIALNLAAEALGIDSERYLFKQLPPPVEGKIERSVYNRRKHHLAFKIQEIQAKIAVLIDPNTDYHIVDSMPLEVCRYSRASRSKTCQDNDYVSPDYGYCAAHNQKYFGYKFHAVCTPNGVIKSHDISKASVHDIHYLDDVKQQFNHCVLVGDKGYLSRTVQLDLFETAAIQLVTPPRKNQLEQTLMHPLLRKARKRIETIYSQLCDQFMIRRNYAKSFKGFATRIISKVTALTMIQWINQLKGNNINNLKIVIA